MSGYQIFCDQYKNGFFNGFSQLQHEEEFVDLTLAADGYLVKAHKNVIAVASPYLREMLKSVPSQSPVIFLNKVNHVILKYIIEYIYQGEVNLPSSLLNEFLRVAKSLHINGISNVVPKKLSKSKSKPIEETVNKGPSNKIAAHITINNVNNSHSLEIQKCNELETISVDLDYNTGIENNKDYVEENFEHQESQEYPSENIAVKSVPLPNDNNEKNNDISEYLWSEKDSLLQLTNKNDVENSSVLIQNVENKGKPLQIIIDATKPTSNVAESIINIIESTDNTCINKQKDLDNPEGDRELGRAIDSKKEFNSENMIIEENDGMDYGSSFITSIQVQPLNEASIDPNLVNNIELDKVDTNDLRSMAQYTISQRGSRQLILNRYMYCCQFDSRRGLRTRWRCIDYRRSKCPAMIDMEKDKIMKRTGVHTHGFHDKKIYQKHRKGLIFNTIEIAKEAYADNPTLFVD